MNNDIITKIFDMRDSFWETENGEAIVFLKHILVYLYEYRNQLSGTENEIYIPGKYDLVMADNILFSLGYRRYSITYEPKGIFPCEYTKITFRNVL